MIEEQLREIDHDSEERGWQNGPHCNPHLFVVWQDSETGQLKWTLPDPLNDAFDELHKVFGNNTALVVKHLAEAREKRQQLWSTAGLPDPTQILGIGLRAEAVKVHTSVTSLTQVMAMLGGAMPTAEIRFTAYFARTGEVAQVNHNRGQKAEFSTDVMVGGGVEESMGLLLEALTAESIRFPWSEK